jgi:tetratricopeptide (TPR) repeat protein/DNA-binding winged helix-turn-helix (wHTH) protein
VNSDLLQGFYLQDLLVEPVTGQVSGREGPVHLPPKAMEVLLCLASTPGTLVTRETLLEEVWGAGQGSQEALSHAVSEIRHALGDHLDNPEFIQTLPKRGYRLIVDAEPKSAGASSVVIGAQGGSGIADIGLLENLTQRGVIETALAYLIFGWLIIQVADIVFGQLHLPAWAGTFVTVLVIAGFPIALVLSWFLEFRHGRAVLQTLPPSKAVRRRFSRTYISVIGALSIAAVVVFLFDRVVGLPEAPTDTSITDSEQAYLPPVLENSIAVLPFLNLDGSDDTEIFASGLADDLITRLSLVPGLLVSSRGDAFTLHPNSASKAVRDRLRVSRYLEGSVQIAGDKIRVIVQLIDSATGFHVLSRSFDRPRRDYFDIRDEITDLTIANVRVTLPSDSQSSVTLAADNPSIDAYVLYRRGVEASRLLPNVAAAEATLAWYDKALGIDPDYAAAHAGKCLLFVARRKEFGTSEKISEAQASCATALSLSPNLDIVHTALGSLYRETGRYDESEKAYLKALNINPKSVDALNGLGVVYRLQQRMDEAESTLRQAIGLHPGDWSAYNALGLFLYRSGRYAEAAEQYESVVALDDTNGLGYSNLGTAYMMAGNFTRAEPALDKASEIEQRGTTFSNLGLLYYYTGRHDEAVTSHRRAIDITPDDYLAWSNLGDALWNAARFEEANQVFQTAEELASSALEVNTNDANTLMDLAWISAMLDKNEVARSLLDRSLMHAPNDPYVHYYNGLVLLRSGDPDAALKSLYIALQKGYPVKIMAAEPHLAALQGDSRFRAMLGRGA